MVNGPLNRYVKLRVAHAPVLPGTIFPPPTSQKPLVSDPGMHHATYVTHVLWCMSGSQTRAGRENVPGIPGPCATRKFTYLVRGPYQACWSTHWIFSNHVNDKINMSLSSTTTGFKLHRLSVEKWQNIKNKQTNKAKTFTFPNTNSAGHGLIRRPTCCYRQLNIPAQNKHSNLWISGHHWRARGNHMRFHQSTNWTIVILILQTLKVIKAP